MGDNIVDKFDIGQVWRSMANPDTRYLVAAINDDTVTLEGTGRGVGTYGFDLAGDRLKHFTFAFYQES